MENLTAYLNSKLFLSLNASNKLAEIISLSTLEKETVFIKKGRNNTKEYILLEGICRSYIRDAEGNEITLSFFTPDTAISPNLIRTISNESILSIQAITAVKLAIFPSEGLMRLMTAHREIEVWANAVLQKELFQKVNKEINQISMHAKQRLVHFRHQYPALENLIPHSYIASYLGITNVSLSRIRKELSSE